MTRRLALRADLLDITDDPGLGAVDSPVVRFDPDCWLLVEGGRIAGRTRETPGEDWDKRDYSGRLLMPGFIDTHVHCPQLDVIASHGEALLPWLERYVFPAERRFEEAVAAREGADRFLDLLLAHGTTAAVVFPTVHKVSVQALFEAAEGHQMRLITGKVLMDRHVPDYLRDDVEGAERDCTELIERWHGRGRAAYALTPRFAPTSTPAQLEMAGRLLARYPGTYMHTHVAENRDEVQWVAELFPQARSYLDVYAAHGLLGPRSVLAHGIWLDDADRRLLAETGAHVAHCPTSNLFLGSGLLDWAKLQEAGVGVSLATDVGAGTTLSMPRTLAEAYKVQALQGVKLSAWKAIYAATRGAARALRLEHEIGSLDVGASADLAVWDWAHGALALHRDRLARELHERVFAWMTLGDERNLVSAWVAGTQRWHRP
ncbi:guanine deaminase [Azohydromonas caseinilytica]|uniref:Guanine deaminase n=1 Tax=Azohydromonas caseinilytica TaxID=2728836 RepID=A0A848F9A7_9BURK|nr:guanine deaminase [Azohydromonas caseinilytica]NML14820.1 guanine deaminase [Azohydromonas caseinilytica]